ncbi:hypothetical protein CDAR_400621 [Caerostris darwini]|uniref:Uncharacterized protein n=1 Tax=Caerostris darwini TaxID=1538125 RepID=A0AAV4S731_9ARAC|nr:hypothetical protein CDAR_400621 [Caerostris darwini]
MLPSNIKILVPKTSNILADDSQKAIYLQNSESLTSCCPAHQTLPRKRFRDFPLCERCGRIAPQKQKRREIPERTSSGILLALKVNFSSFRSSATPQHRVIKNNFHKILFPQGYRKKYHKVFPVCSLGFKRQRCQEAKFAT